MDKQSILIIVAVGLAFAGYKYFQEGGRVPSGFGSFGGRSESSRSAGEDEYDSASRSNAYFMHKMSVAADRDASHQMWRDAAYDRMKARESDERRYYSRGQ